MTTTSFVPGTVAQRVRNASRTSRFTRLRTTALPTRELTVMPIRTRPAVLGEARDGAVQSVVTGLAHHAGALVVGYLLCLAVLAVRHRFVARARERQAANLSGSPAPTRTTSG